MPFALNLRVSDTMSFDCIFRDCIEIQNFLRLQLRIPRAELGDTSCTRFQDFRYDCHSGSDRMSTCRPLIRVITAVNAAMCLISLIVRSRFCGQSPLGADACQRSDATDLGVKWN